MDRYIIKTSRSKGSIHTTNNSQTKRKSTMDRFLIKTPRTKESELHSNSNECHEQHEFSKAKHKYDGSDGYRSNCRKKTSNKNNRWLEIDEDGDDDDNDECSITKSTIKRQSTIHSLPCVVVIEEIHAFKAKLKLPNQSPDILLQCLEELKKKIPPRHILLSTKIGHSVKKLIKHKNETVSKAAKQVYIKWRRFFEDKLEKPQIEVRCDQKTENLRLRGKTYLSEILGVSIDHILIEGIERETFYTHKRLISPAYRRSLRNYIFKLKCSEQLGSDLKSGAITIEEFVKQYKKS